MKKEIECIYNNKKMKTIIYDEYVSIGNKNIHFSNIYKVHKDKLFGKHFLTKKVLYVSASLLNFLLYLLLNINPLLIISLLTISILIIDYVISIDLNSKLKDDFTVTFDIIYTHSHDTLLIKHCDLLDFNLRKKATNRLSFFQKIVLKKYIKRLSYSKKYLMSQIESNRFPSKEIFDRYYAISTTSLSLDNTFNLDTCEYINNLYKVNLHSYVNKPVIFFRINFILFITIIYFLNIRIGLF